MTDNPTNTNQDTNLDTSTNTNPPAETNIDNMNLEAETDLTHQEDSQEDVTERSINDMTFNDIDAVTTFGDYDLSRFKDVIDLSNEDIVNSFTEQAKILKEKNFTQEQVEWLLQNEIDNIAKKPKLTYEDVQKNLRKTLSLSELRSYDATKDLLEEAVTGNTELEKYYTETISNPYMMKVLIAMHQKIKGTGQTLNTKQTREVKQKTITYDEALDVYSDILDIPKEKRGDRVEKLIGSLNEQDKNRFKKHLNFI